MTRFHISLLFILMSFSIAFGQNNEYDPDYDIDYKVTSVAGVKFGESEYSVKSDLQSHLGYNNKDFGAYIEYYEPTIGGINFTFGDFYFANKKLAAAELTKIFPLNQFQKAKDFRDMVALQYGSKYANIHSNIDRNGYRYYVCGMVEDDRYPIVISIIKGEGKDGKTRYYVMVNYYNVTEALNDDI